MNVTETFDTCHHALMAGEDTPEGRDAADVLLRAVAEGRIDPGKEYVVVKPELELKYSPLLHCAAENYSAEFLQRLLALGKCSPSTPQFMMDGLRWLPMHCAARSPVDPVAKCMLLPAEDLDSRHKVPESMTPLVACIVYSVRAMQVVRWMLDQPECCVDEDPFVPLLLGNPNPEYGAVIELLRGGIAARQQWKQRWGPLRAAWVATVSVGATALP
jgi:hypothetical protein